MNPYRTAALLLAALLPAACNDQTAPPATQTEASSTQPTYRVFTEQAYPPFIMHDGGGEVSGFEYELLQAIAEKQDFKLTYHPHPWKGLFATLNANQSDILSASITITEERKKNMDFSEPYFESETVLLIHNKAAKHIKSFAHLNGSKVAVKSGTSQHEILQQHGAQPLYTDTTWQSITAVLNGKSDAALGDLGVMAYYAQRYQNDGLQLVRDSGSSKETLGFAVKKGNSALQQKLNNGLNQIKQDGTYHTIYQKWFGKTAE